MHLDIIMIMIQNKIQYNIIVRVTLLKFTMECLENQHEFSISIMIVYLQTIRYLARPKMNALGLSKNKNIDVNSISHITILVVHAAYNGSPTICV